MAEELKDRLGGAICNIYLLGSEALRKIIKFEELHDTWQKANPEKIEFTCHRNQSNIHSSLAKFMQPKTLPY